MITIEKVAVLRSVPIFKDIPDDVLASIALIAEEVNLADGETFIKEGELGECMYLIVEGETQVFSNGKTIIVLGPGQVVGELAVLDPEPRSASVSALGSVMLFRIEKAPFDEVMADRPEIASGVIRALCQRVREQGRRMAAQPLADTMVEVPGSVSHNSVLVAASDGIEGR